MRLDEMDVNRSSALSPNMYNEYNDILGPKDFVYFSAYVMSRRCDMKKQQDLLWKIIELTKQIDEQKIMLFLFVWLTKNAL